MTWDELPIVIRGIELLAEVIGRSERQIKRELRDGRFRPAPLARTGREAWRWNKDTVKAYVEERDQRRLRRVS